MSDISNVILELEKQQEAINRALSALREVSGFKAPTSAAESPGAPLKRRMSEEGRQRIAEGIRKRWADKRAAESSTANKTAAKKVVKKSASKKTATRKTSAQTSTKKATRKQTTAELKPVSE